MALFMVSNDNKTLYEPFKPESSEIEANFINTTIQSSPRPIFEFRAIFLSIYGLRASIGPE